MGKVGEKWPTSLTAKTGERCVVPGHYILDEGAYAGTCPYAVVALRSSEPPHPGMLPRPEMIGMELAEPFPPSCDGRSVRWRLWDDPTSWAMGRLFDPKLFRSARLD